MAATVGLSLWAAEHGLGDFPLPRDQLEAYAQERAGIYRLQPQRHTRGTKQRSLSRFRIR